ncbi:MAG: hypothetical protein QM564_11760 [Bergeyella sp.]
MNPASTYFPDRKATAGRLTTNGITTVAITITSTSSFSSVPIYVDMGNGDVVYRTQNNLGYTYSSPYTGIIKFYSKNKVKPIKSLLIEENATTAENVKHKYHIKAEDIKAFRGLETFSFYVYYYNVYERNYSTISGNWSKDINPTLKYLRFNFNSNDASQAQGVFNINELPSDSPLTYLCFGYYWNMSIGARFGTITGKLQNLPQGLQTFIICLTESVTFDTDGNNLSHIQAPLISLCLKNTNITGYVSDIPYTLEELRLYGTSTQISGQFASTYKPNLKYLDLNTLHTSYELDLTNLKNGIPNLINLDLTSIKVTGDIMNLPETLTRINITNTSGTITGDVDNLPKNTYTVINFSCTNTLYGDIGNIPATTTLSIAGNNTISGDIANAKATGTLYITGNNTISGDIANAKATGTLTITGNNTISGDIANAKATGTLYITGNNTISGDIANAKATGTLSIAGNNTISGDIGLMTVVPVTSCTIEGHNTINAYTPGKNWNGLTTFKLTGYNTLSSTDVDNLLIDMANSITATVTCTITIKGNSQPRTSTSDAAVAILQAKGRTVITN